MEDYESNDVLAELARLCDELGLDHMDSEAMACETHIFVDANGNPHECWEAGPGHINVTVAMTPEQAVRITDVMTENAKLCDDNARLRELVRHMHECMSNVDADGNHECFACEYENAECEFDSRMRELGVEVD